METFLLIILLAVLLIRWMFSSGRMSELQQRIEVLEHGSADARLTPRIEALEKEVGKLLRERWSGGVVTEPVPKPVAIPEPVKLPERNFCVYCGKPLPQPPTICECQREKAPEQVTVIPVPAPLPTPVVARMPLPEIPVVHTPTISDRLREKMSGEEWEVLVGGSWLNKLGVFVLVIGIALFLGYSFTKMGPPGRVAIGLAVSLGMLVGGILLEKRARYTIFGRGLLGGGWGALYFTTYAMHAVEAARVIDNAIAASLLLLAVAAGMIVHSLRYRSQTVTGLTYFLAFATLSPVITPVASLSALALIPLAASLLYVANRFAWSELALFGLIATYGTCASLGDSGAPVWAAQTIFTTYWLLFESFDLLRARRRTEYTVWEQAIFPLNAAAFLLLSYAKWSAGAPDQLFALAAGVGAAYLTSAVLRAVLRPPSSFAAGSSPLGRAFSGGYEAPITLTAALSVAAIFLKFHGLIAEAGLLAEAELFFLAGLYFGEAYPRQLAALLFAGSAGKLLVDDIPAGRQTNQTWFAMAWTPVAALSGFLFYLNRALRSADKFYGYAGSAAIALIIGFEVPQHYLGTAWLALAAVLFGLGWQRRLEDFRIQGYIGAGLGLAGTAFYQADVASGAAPPLPHPWIALVCAAVCAYAGVQCALRSAVDRLNGWERTALRRVGSWASTVALVALAWRILPQDYLGLGWLAVALLILELGLRRAPEDFRLQSYVVAALGGLHVLIFNLIPVSNAGPLAPRLTIAGAALLFYAIAVRIYRAHEDAIQPGERSLVFDASSAAGTCFTMAAIWALLPSVVIGPAWAIVSLLLIEIGFGLDTAGLRFQGHIAAACGFGRLFFANFTGLGSVGFVSHRLVTVIPVIVSQYYQWSRQNAARARLKDWELPLSRAYLYAAAVLGVVLMRFELGRVLTVTGWAAFALGLLILGNRWNNFDLRWQSYALSGLVFWRSWTTNFYAPESFAGVSGRILTGAFVVACFYAAHVLTPRRPAEDNSIERHARLFYSMLASILLAVLLFYEVSGSMLTVAWGLEGVALLLAGFPLNDRVFRLSGMALFTVCVLKLFLYDLRHLETLYRILSFIVLGLMLVSVSWIYTRFHDRIRRYL
ncbi:MAG TPA: DUF2339 domain-containing protein [Bryobacteraceae bacterium]|nr:DUF2339 domain-containing protein [Bryobacteraceae bacterium]